MHDFWLYGTLCIPGVGHRFWIRDTSMCCRCRKRGPAYSVSCFAGDQFHVFGGPACSPRWFPTEDSIGGYPAAQPHHAVRSVHSALQMPLEQAGILRILSEADLGAEGSRADRAWKLHVAQASATSHVYEHLERRSSDKPVHARKMIRNTDPQIPVQNAIPRRGNMAAREEV